MGRLFGSGASEDSSSSGLRSRGPGTILLLGLWLTAAAGGGEIVLNSGSAGGVYDSVGLAISELSERFGRRVTIRAVRSSGSVENIERIVGNGNELGLVQCDLLHDAYDGRGVFGRAHSELRVIALLGREALHVVARRELGITAIDGLRGRRIALGPPGSGSAATGWQALEAHGLDARDVEVVRLNTGEALAAFAGGDVDAVVFVGAVPFAPVREALQWGTLVSLERASAQTYLAEGSYLSLEELPLSAYGGEGSVLTFSVDTALVAPLDMNADAAYELAELIFAHVGRLEEVHPSLQGLEPGRTDARAPIPLHPGALRLLDNLGAIPRPAKVFTGFYIYSITELDLVEGSFLVDGFVWFRWKSPLLGDDSFEFSFVNGTIESIDEARPIEFQGWRRQSRRFTARFRAGFVLYDYPFDSQVLPLVVEHRWYGSGRLEFVPDTEAELSGDAQSSFLGEQVQVGDWTIAQVEHRGVIKKFETDFGSLRKDEWDLRSSRYEFLITIERAVLPYLAKVVFPLTVFVLMTYCVFFINPKEFLAQAGMCIVALLTCVAFHTFQSDSLPAVGYLVAADKFFLLSYLVILLALMATVWCHRVHSRGDVQRARRLAARFRWLFPPLYFLPMLILLVVR